MKTTSKKAPPTEKATPERAAFDDPRGLLQGTGKTGRHLKRTRLDALPRDAVRGWLEAAAKAARAKT